MKKTLLTTAIALLLMFGVSPLKAQEYLLRETKKQVLAELPVYPIRGIKRTNDKSMVYLIFNISENHDIVPYFDEVEKCVMVVEIFKDNNIFFTVLEDLNKRFSKVTDNSWVNKSNDIKITLRKMNDGFSVRYDPI